MTEIEQLRQDIEKLEAAEGVFRRKYGQDYKQYNTELARMRKRLAKLEAEAAAAADPWANAKWQAKNLGNDGRPDIYNYANRLENRIAELEAELAKRPVVWCDRLPDGDYLRYGHGYLKIFTDNEKQNTSLVYGQFEPYTGEQK